MSDRLITVKSRYFGDRVFYKTMLAVLVPIVLQNTVNNFVSLLDNIMVGSLGTEQMSGVSIVNQYFFVFNLLCFGVVSAAGIFTAQYQGSGDIEGVRSTFRAKFYMCVAAALLGGAALYLFQEPLIDLFLYDGSTGGDLALTMSYGKEYLMIILTGLLPFALSMAYSSTMRETGNTVIPMIAGFVSVGVNALLNTLLIFGLFGLPALGVKGAAIATAVSRWTEFVFLLFFAYRKNCRCPAFRGAFAHPGVSAAIMKRIAVKGFPLMSNELLWALSITFRNQCESTRGLDAVAAQNIASTITNLFSVVYLSMGTAISIIIGNQLGARRYEQAEDTDRKLIVFSMLASGGFGVILAGLSHVFPLIYNTSDEARSIAGFMILLYAVCNPVWAYINAAYYTIRTGGQVFETMLSDSIFMWAVVIPTVFICAHFTDMSIYWLYFAGTAAECLKAVLGKFLLSRKTWIRQIVGE